MTISFLCSLLRKRNASLPIRDTNLERFKEGSPVISKEIRQNVLIVALVLAAVSLPADIFGQFVFPAGEGMPLKTRCLGFNTEAEAARRFMEGGMDWEMMAIPSAPETHRVAVILAEFQEDQDTLTTGNGLFGSLPFYRPHPDTALAAQGRVIRDTSINSRSRVYYARHLVWVSQYLSAVSGGLFTTEIPDTLEDIAPIVQLPEEMSYYGNNNQFGQRQTEFVRDAIAAADTLTDIDFSLYDAVLVFHAGAGEESDFGPPPMYTGDSPNDLFSVYIPFEALKLYVGDGDPLYQGIRTTGPGGAEFYVRNAMIVPETLIQDSLYNPSAVYLDILGIVAHEYGHELGLPDLSDTDTSTRPAVGNFCFMSSGLYNSSGRLPAHPMAWCKMFLGWERPVTVSRDTSGVVLKGIERPGGGTRLIKVPISSSEYFLMENRLRDSDFDGDFLFDDADGDNWPDLIEDDYQLDDGTYSEFDFGLPGILTVDSRTGDPYDDPLLGSGVLIWHVDEEVIRKNFRPDYTENCVNCNVFHPGIDLEEADGIQHLDAILPQTIDPGYGSPFDSYGGRVPGAKEDPNTEFSGGTSPGSASYTGGATDIRISGFRSFTIDPGDVLVDSLVAIDIGFASYVPGWPVTVQEEGGFDFGLAPSTFGGNGICAADIDGDGENEIAIVTRDGEIFLWNSDGTNFMGGDREIRPFYSLGQGVNGAPALGDLTGDGNMELVVVTDEGLVYTLWWSPTTPPDPPWGVLDGFPVDLGEMVYSSPLLLDLDTPADGVIDRIVVGSIVPDGGTNGEVHSMNTDGSITAGWPLTVMGSVEGTPAAADVDRDGAVDMIVATMSGYVYRLDESGNILWTKFLDGESFTASPTLGDIDRDGDSDGDGIAERLGDLEIVLGSTTGRIFILTVGGQTFGGEPIETGGAIRVPVSLGDIDRDGFVEIVALNNDDREIAVYRSNTSGSSINSLANFPKRVSSSSVSGNFFSPPLLADLDGNGVEEIIFGTAVNMLYAYDLTANATPLMRYPLGAKGTSPPFVGTSPGDTLALMAADERGMVYGWQMDVLAGDVSISWAQEGRDHLHASANGDSLGESVSSSESPFSEDTYTIYPNPAPGRSETNQVKITYSLNEAVSALSLDIYTVSGRHYRKITPSSSSYLLPDARHVLNWDISGVPSGIYILRLSIEKADGGSEYLIKKAAIVK